MEMPGEKFYEDKQRLNQFKKALGIFGNSLGESSMMTELGENNKQTSFIGNTSTIQQSFMFNVPS